MKKKPLVALSFDDGRSDNYNIFMKNLYSLNIPATIYIATGYINEECGLGEDQVTEPLSVSQIRDISHVPFFEVSCHGNLHNNDFDDILIGKQILSRWIHEDSNFIGFASPGSFMSLPYLQKNKEYIKKLDFSYIRSGSDFQVRKKAINRFKSISRRIFKRLYRIYHNNILYYFAYQDSYIDSKNDNSVLTSFPVFHYTSEKTLRRIVKTGIKKEKNMIFMFHSIKKENENDYTSTWSWDYNCFQSFIVYLKELIDNEKIEVVTVLDLSRKLI